MPDPDTTPRTPVSDEEWLESGQVAQLLKLNPSTVRLWISRGRLRAVRPGGRKWLVHRSEIDRILSTADVSRAYADKDLRTPPTGGGEDVSRRPLPGEQLIQAGTKAGS